MNTWHYSYIEALGILAEGCQTWQLNRREAVTAPYTPGPTRLSTYVQHRHTRTQVHNTYQKIQVADHTDPQTGAHINSSDGLILFPSLSNQDEALLVENTHTSTRWIHQ